MKIRDGNDFVLNWGIVRGGVAEDLSVATSAKLQIKRFGKTKEITEFNIIGESNNILHIEFTPDVYWGVGIYTLELHYVLPDPALSDGGRMCAVDEDGFEIVPRTSMADDTSDISHTSEIGLALRGKSAYEVWLETHEGSLVDYEAWLRSPAITAGGYAAAQGNYAKDQGDHAKTQGDYAKEKGDYAKAQGDYVLGLQILRSETYSETIYNEI